MGRETYEFVGVEDGLGDACELYARHGELPGPLLRAGPEGLCEDLVAKAHTWCGDDRGMKEGEVV